VEALQAAKTSDFEQAEENLTEANQYFVEGHKVHASLIQKEAAGEAVEFSMLFIHAEDQLMSTETITTLVREMIEMYKKMEETN
jgi:PTS system cellobiose-specific IIA component